MQIDFIILNIYGNQILNSDTMTFIVSRDEGYLENECSFISSSTTQWWCRMSKKISRSYQLRKVELYMLYILNKASSSTRGGGVL